MLYLDPNKEKLLTFEVEVSGDACENIQSHVRLFVDEVEIGFPAVFQENKIIAIIKPLRTFFKLPLKNGTLIEGRLDVLSENQDFYTPWQGQIEIKSSFTVEAKLIGEEKPKDKDSRFTVKTLVEDQIEELITKTEPLQEKKAAPKPVAKSTPKPVVPKAAPKPAPKPVAQVKKQVVTETKSSKITPKDLQNITKEGVFEYMTRAGSKNERIQEIIYDQATQKAGSGRPFDVLKEVVKILNRKSDTSPSKIDMLAMQKMAGRKGLNDQD